MVPYNESGGFDYNCTLLLSPLAALSQCYIKFALSYTFIIGNFSKPVIFSSSDPKPPCTPEPPYLVDKAPRKLHISWTLPLFDCYNGALPTLWHLRVYLHLNESHSNKYSDLVLIQSYEFASDIYSNVISDLEANRTYLVKLSLSNLGGKSNFTSTLMTTAPPSVPDPPNSPVITKATPLSLQVEWNENVNDNGAPITEFHVFVYVNGSMVSSPVSIVPFSKTVAEIAHLSIIRATTEYMVAISAKNSIGISQLSNASLPIVTPPPWSPVIYGYLTVVALSRHSVYASWPDVVSDGGAQVFFNVNAEFQVEKYEGVLHKSFPALLCNRSALNSSFCGALIDGLPWNTSIAVQVAACNWKNCSYYPVNTVHTFPPSVPLPPKQIQISIYVDYAELSWLPPKDDGGYIVQSYRIEWAAIKQVDANSSVYDMPLDELKDTIDPHILESLQYNQMSVAYAPEYYIRNLFQSTIYSVRIRAKNILGQGIYSKEFIFATSPASPPSEVIHIITNTAGKDSIRVAWIPPNSDDTVTLTYRVYYSKNPVFDVANVSFIDVRYSNVTIEGFSMGQNYAFWVVAINFAGQGPLSNQTIIHRINSPISLSPIITPKLNVSHIDSYKVDLNVSLIMKNGLFNETFLANITSIILLFAPIDSLFSPMIAIPVSEKNSDQIGKKAVLSASFHHLLRASEKWEPIVAPSLPYVDNLVLFSSIFTIRPLFASQEYKITAMACNLDGCGPQTSSITFKTLKPSPPPSFVDKIIVSSVELRSAVIEWFDWIHLGGVPRIEYQIFLADISTLVSQKEVGNCTTDPSIIESLLQYRSIFSPSLASYGKPNWENDFISEYLAQFNRQSNAQSYELSGLTPNTTYAVAVKVVTAYGTGITIASVFKTKPITKPDPLPFLSCQSIEKDSFILVWSSPKSDGGSPLLLYIIHLEESTPNKPNLYGFHTPPRNIKVAAETLSLLLSNLAADTLFNITIIAENEHGFKSQSAVQCLTLPPTTPGQVSSPLIETRIRSLLVSWMHPEEFGGIPIISYCVSLRSFNTSTKNDLKQICVDNETLSLVLDNLCENITFEVYIWANNQVGSGPTSEILEASPLPDSPGKPILIRVTSIIARSKWIDVVLSFSPPNDWGGSQNLQYSVSVWKRSLQSQSESDSVLAKENIPCQPCKCAPSTCIGGKAIDYNSISEKHENCTCYCDIAMLDSEMMYRFNVVAMSTINSSVGIMEEWIPIRAVLPDSPPMPVLIYNTPSNARIQLEKPSFCGGADILAFSIEARISTALKVSESYGEEYNYTHNWQQIANITVNEFSTEYPFVELPHLFYSTNYEIRTAAQNIAGMSGYSPILHFTTPPFSRPHSLHAISIANSEENTGVLVQFEFSGPNYNSSHSIQNSANQNIKYVVRRNSWPGLKKVIYGMCHKYDAKQYYELLIANGFWWPLKWMNSTSLVESHSRLLLSIESIHNAEFSKFEETNGFKQIRQIQENSDFVPEFTGPDALNPPFNLIYHEFVRIFEHKTTEEILDSTKEESVVIASIEQEDSVRSVKITDFVEYGLIVEYTVEVKCIIKQLLQLSIVWQICSPLFNKLNNILNQYIKR